MALVAFKRYHTSEISSLPVIDGQLIWDIDNGSTYIDVSTTRIETGIKYILPISTTETLGGIKSGGDISVDTETGIVSVNDNSHNHIIGNISGLQTVLDGKLDISGNAVSASKINTARNISLSGDVSGNILFDGSADVNITTVVADNSHNHTTSNITGLQSELDGKLSNALKGSSDGLAELDSNGKVPSSQLPSYVDDVIEGTLETFPTIGESGKIYIDTNTNITYRWSGSIYAPIGSDLALGETASTAYPGDKGVLVTNNLNTHLSDTSNPHSVTKVQIGLENVDNTADINKNVLSATKLTTSRTINNVAFDGTSNITIEDSTKEPIITNGLESQFLSGNKTWRDLATDVRAIVLTGLSTTTNSVISATDTILGALGKLQAQITSLGTTKANLDSPTLTGTPTAPTAVSGTNTTQIATTAFVQDAVSGSSSGGGTNIQTSSTQPTDQSTGDMWYEII